MFRIFQKYLDHCTKKYFYHSVREEKRKYNFSNNTSLLDACVKKLHLDYITIYYNHINFIFILGQSYITNALNLHLNYTQISNLLKTAEVSTSFWVKY